MKLIIVFILFLVGINSRLVFLNKERHIKDETSGQLNITVEKTQSISTSTNKVRKVYQVKDDFLVIYENYIELLDADFNVKLNAEVSLGYDHFVIGEELAVYIEDINKQKTLFIANLYTEADRSITLPENVNLFTLTPIGDNKFSYSTEDSKLYVIDFTTGNQVLVIETQKVVPKIRLSHEGLLFINYIYPLSGASQNANLDIYELSTGKLLRTLTNEKDYVYVTPVDSENVQIEIREKRLIYNFKTQETVVLNNAPQRLYQLTKNLYYGIDVYYNWFSPRLSYYTYDSSLDKKSVANLGYKVEFLFKVDESTIVVFASTEAQRWKIKLDN